MNITRRGFLAVAGAAVATLAGCSSGEPKGSAGAQSEGAGGMVANREPVALEIVESGYSVSESGFVMYGIAIKNPNEGFEAQYVTFNITGKADDGSIVFNDEQTTYVIFPGETTHYGFQAGNGTAPATVEFSLSEPQWVESSSLESDVFTISNVSEVDNGYGNTSFTGELTANAEINSEMFRQVAITVITRDETGAINYGYTTFSDIPSKDQATPFELSGYNVPAHASYELYAQLW